MAYTQLSPRFTPGSRVEQISSESSHYLLTIPSGKADEYRLAQLDDYATLAKRKFPHRSLTLSLSARTSSDSIPGTWGFGLWNDPFGMSLGFGGRPFRVPALPNAVWFFGASKESYLSFRESRLEWNEERTLRRRQLKDASTTLRSAQRGVANGFLAQTFRAPRFHPLLIPAGLSLPFSRKTMRRLLSRVIVEDAIELSRVDLPVALTGWHRYSLEWSPNRVSFEVDQVQVFESTVSPNPPLGLVIWIDNQYAAFTPEGRIGFGILENPEPAWLEVKDISIGS
jgi:hypothetical protein